MVREVRFRLTGGTAVLALTVMAGFVRVRYLEQVTTLDTEAADELRFWLASEYAAHGLPVLEEAVERGDAAPSEAMANELVARRRIEFASITARGRTDDVVVRVEIRVDGTRPPEDRTVRHFRMEHSAVVGWRMRREVNAVLYHLKLL